MAKQKATTPAAEMVAIDRLKPWARNPRKNDGKPVDEVAASIQRFGFGAPILARLADGEIIGGHTRYKAAQKLGLTEVPVRFLDLSESEAHALALSDNRTGELAAWDDAELLAILRDVATSEQALAGTGFDEAALAALVNGLSAPDGGGTGISLQERFLVPPFSVLDARQGYWQERKRQWIALGIRGELGRGERANGLLSQATERSGYGMDYDTSNGENAWGGSGISVFDPVLCELVYRWFMPAAASSILDPFGGEATKGIVAAYLGHRYTAVELRAEQVAVNDEQARAIKFPGDLPCWIEGDSGQLEHLLPAGEGYDMIFTSPPYYDLEIYSQSEKDGSAFETFEGFMLWYRGIFAQAVARLRPNRFVVVKVGEVRDRKTGAYRNFLGENIRCFLDLGLTYYNEAVLITSVGSMPVRAAGPFTSARKLAKGHQNVLVFYKGDPRKISEHFTKEIDVHVGDPVPE